MDQRQLGYLETEGLRYRRSGHYGRGYEMLPEECVQAFERLLGRLEPQIVNSTGDLQGRIRQWVRLESLRAGEQAAVAPTQAGLDYEQRIAAVWRQVLGLEQVGLHDNFFELGGNSLIALQLVSRLKREFKHQIPAVALFEAPTVRAMAEYLRPDPVRPEDSYRDRLAHAVTASAIAVTSPLLPWRAAFQRRLRCNSSGATCVMAWSPLPTSPMRNCWPRASMRRYPGPQIRQIVPNP